MTLPDSTSPDRLYTRRFFALFAALFAYMCGFGMMPHFPQYIEHLGGDVGTVGWIVGLGMVGSLISRPFLGSAVDRAGARPVLVGASLLASAAMLTFQWVDSLILAGLLRVFVQLSLAAFLVGIAVRSAQIAPPGRSAESLASVGIAGLTGIMIGPAVGDLIFTGREHQAAAYHLFFSLAAGLMLASAVVTACTHAPSFNNTTLPASGHVRASFFKLAWRYWPGPVVVMALCMASSQTIPQTFIERLADARGFANIKWFFFAYAPTAILFRVLLRRAPQIIGRRRALLIGMTSYALGTFLLVGTDSETALIIPAMVMGLGHCFSYPFILDLAADRMPPAHRGTAVAVILAVVDLGFLLGNVIWAQLIDHYGFDHTLILLASTTIIGTVYFAIKQRAR